MNCKDHKRLKNIERLVTAIYQHLKPLPIPGEITIKLISERKESDVNLLTFEATLPTMPLGTDVESQLFDVSVDGSPQVQRELTSDVVTATFEVPQDSNVTLSLIYVDDGGNLSPARTQEFVAKDTIPASQPGPFGEVKLISERDVP